MTTATAPAPAATDTDAAVYRRVAWRIIPFLFVCYIVAFLDRVNVGYAKLQMAADLKFSDEIYGLGAGMFFIGYFFFEVPSNLILERVGARVWIARILILWGVISASFMYVEPMSRALGIQTATGFYLLRFLLGMGEAGYFPGINLYLTKWFPSAYRNRMTATFMSAVPLTGVLGGPTSTWIMKTFAGTHGLAGWQWLFLLEGLPAVIIGCATLIYLDDGPKTAKWLSQPDRELVLTNLVRDHAAKESVAGHHGFLPSLRDYRVWVLTLVYFCFALGVYSVTLWLPQSLRDAGVKDIVTIGFLSAIPYAIAGVAMLANGKHSDATMERRWHVATPAILAGIGLALGANSAGSLAIVLVAFSLALGALLSGVSAFWSLPTAFLSGTAAAGGIALINSFGNLGGFFGPYLIGWSKDHLGSQAVGLYVVAAFLIGAAALIVGVFKKAQARPQPWR
jgi:sugar phosphate permease